MLSADHYWIVQEALRLGLHALHTELRAPKLSCPEAAPCASVPACPACDCGPAVEASSVVLKASFYLVVICAILLAFVIGAIVGHVATRERPARRRPGQRRGVMAEY